MGGRGGHLGTANEDAGDQVDESPVVRLRGVAYERRWVVGLSHRRSRLGSAKHLANLTMALDGLTSARIRHRAPVTPARA